MYQTILAAIDRSPQSGGVYEKAVELAQLTGAHLLLFHCLPIEDIDTYSYSDLYGANLINFSRVMQEHLEKQADETRKWLEGLAHQAEAKTVKVSWEWKFGSAGAMICNQAKACDADLIVIGRRGQRGVGELLAGSVSNFVVHRANCSVLVVQGKATA